MLDDTQAFLTKPACGGVNCRDISCQYAVAQHPGSGRWFITLCHPGFNSPANNLHGYATRSTALAAFRKYSARGTRRIGRR